MTNVSRRPRTISSRASGRTGQPEGEQHRKTTDTAPDEETNKKQKRRGKSAQDRQRGERLAECAEEEDARCTTAQGEVSWGHLKPTQRGSQRPQTPGTAWCRGRCPTQGRSLCCHTVRRRREEGESPSPDQSVADKRSCRPARRPDRCRGNQIVLRNTDQHHQTPRGGGAEGRAAAGEHQTNPEKTTGPDTEAIRGQRQARPTMRRPKTQETQQRQTQRPTTEATGKGKRHGIRPRESQQGNPYRGTKNVNYNMKEGPDDFLNVRRAIDTEKIQQNHAS